MVRLSDIYGVLRNVKKVTTWNDTKTPVDLDHMEKYEVMSINAIFNTSGLHIRVKEIPGNGGN